MTDNKYPISDVKEIVMLGVQVAMAIDEASEDGVDWRDVLHFVPLIADIPTAISGIDRVPRQLADMTDDERNEIVDAIRKLNIKDEKAEEITEQSFVIGLEIAKLLTILRK